MATQIVGVISWSLKQDDKWGRAYTVAYLIKGIPQVDGPAHVLDTIGLPAVGQFWDYFGDIDVWALRTPEVSITPADGAQGEPTEYWKVEFTYKTPSIPTGNKGDNQFCKDFKVEDPLLQPSNISGSFSHYSERAPYDLFGRPLTNSALEPLTGPEVEFDRSRGQVKIERNVASFDVISLAVSMLDHVNDAPLWGLPRRCIKLSNAPWSRHFYGNCEVYYTLSLEFDVRADTFDRVVQDRGTKVLHGHWGAIKGSGCTLTLTTAGGAITAAVVKDKGTGYPADALILLAMKQGAGQNGLVYVQTNAAGVVTSVSSIYNGGSGYRDGDAGSQRSATLQETGWIVDQINGQLPNRYNPQHFDRAIDRKGEPITVNLNGAGLPAAVIATLAPGLPGSSAPPYYISRKNSNKNNQLTDIQWWLPVLNPPGAPLWDNAKVDYQRGQLVTYTVITPPPPVQFFVCILEVGIPVPITDTAFWIEANDPTAISGWDVADSYVAGDIVVYTNPATGQADLYICDAHILPGEDPPTTNANWIFICPNIPGLSDEGVFDANGTYVEGDWVQTGGGAPAGVAAIYIALVDNPPFDITPDVSESWFLIANIPPGVVNKGIWSSAATYSMGQYVLAQVGTTQGAILIQKYPEANFLLLGVPSDLSTTVG